MKINLNADLGESFGPWKMGDDEALLAVVGSASIACGFHAGDPVVMRRTVRAALAAGVTIGAHPGYPDLQGFGRRPMQMAPAELEAAILYQVGALSGIAKAEGARLTHVKPHGALSNQACADSALADTVARAVSDFDCGLILLAPARSELSRAGRRAGLTVAEEIFADRSYTDEGLLAPRGAPGAVIHDPALQLAHVRRMLESGGIVAQGGKVLPTPIHSVCVHGDTPGAATSARRLREALVATGFEVVGLPEMVGEGG